jgi:hypothetical protein
MTAPLRWAMLVSALVGLIGLQWWVMPDTYPFGSGAGSLVSVSADAAAAGAGVLGSVGVATAWALGRRRYRRPALAGTGVQAVALGYALPRSALDAVSRHGLDAVDAGSLYALGTLSAGTLWLLVFVREVRALHNERIESARSLMGAERPGQRDPSVHTDPQLPM